MAVVVLGGGRTRTTDAIDPSVGIAELQPLGTKVSRGDPIAIVHAADLAAAEQVAAEIRQRIYRITDDCPAAAPVLLGRVE
jgi:thymidine phosphorylase